jgi:hypothetical protein
VASASGSNRAEHRAHPATVTDSDFRNEGIDMPGGAFAPDTTVTRCAVANCRTGDSGTPGTVVAGLRLCAGCVRSLGGALTDLPALYRECERVLGGGLAGGLGERTTGGRLPGLPFNERAADARAAIVGTLSSWCGLVAEERQVTPPPRDVAALTAFLRRHAAWLAAHSAAGEAAAELTAVARAARRVVRAEPVQRSHVGKCVEPGCSGQLVAWIRPDAGVSTRTRVDCDADPNHRWSGDQWTALRARLRAAGGAPDSQPCWLTAQDVATLWSTSMGTVYRLASEHAWRRVRRSGAVYYAEPDVRACFESRRAATAALTAHHPES